MTSLPVPDAVAQALEQYPDAVRRRLLQVRDLIFAVAAETEGVGPLTETLKWGEPAYLTETSKSGTTIRLGASRSAPDQCAVFVNCQTTLIDTFRAHFADDFTFEGQRALLFPATGDFRREPLVLCLRAALTYHRQKAAQKTQPA
ncbi:DUF1801 domain-containing protein [Rhizobium sp. LjRoot98]|uniref:DUF1801 domain-containing protein n=1 Tax=Rhizobium sp. LjRoot98 TaxID=3342345 RepID=UPI003ECE2BFA